MKDAVASIACGLCWQQKIHYFLFGNFVFKGKIMHCMNRSSIFCLLVILLAFSYQAQAVILQYSASLRSYSKDLRDESLDDSDLMAVASNQDHTDFALMVAHLRDGNLNAADSIATNLGYRVVNFTDTDTGKSYYHLREGDLNTQAVKGWGSYFFNSNSTANVLVQAPHIRFDTHSYDVAAVAFANSGALALMMNGAHRNAGGKNVADVAHLQSSIFQTVHEVWTTDSTVQAWQIHGFSMDTKNSQGDFIHENVPAGTDILVSNGDGTMSVEILRLDDIMEADSYIGDDQTILVAYNTLPVDHPDNVAVNGNVPGTDMSSLGGTTNVQGIYTRSLNGTFVHIELEQSIRLDGTLAEDLSNRETAGLAIASAINTVPEPSSVGFVLLGSVLLLRRKSRC